MCIVLLLYLSLGVISNLTVSLPLQKKLRFDDEENAVSEAAKDLIRGLLEEANHRLNHSAIVQHKFFLLVNWNDLQNCMYQLVH